MRGIAILTLVVTALAAEAVSWAQEGQYAGLETVRSVEVGVALVAADGKGAEYAAASVLTADELRILIDGVEVPATALEAMISSPSAEPWQFLIYVDAALSSTELVARSAAALGAQVRALADLGTVELVVADPLPRRLLAPTRDPALVDGAISSLALEPTGSDALVALRAELHSASVGEGGRADRARELLAREVEIVRRQQDRLLAWLVTHAHSPSKRVLFLVSGGFDLHPEAYYAAGFEGEVLPDSGLLADHAAISGAVAGFGWLAVAMQLPVPDPLPRRWGLRRQLLVRVDGNWDPERAEAELELGESLIRQEKWKRAEAALERSLHAFQGQPKLRSRQAHALGRLGHVLELQGRTAEAHKVYRKAIELDPGLAVRFAPGVAGLLDPLEPLAALAEATAGGIVRDHEELGRLLEGLRYRSRLSFQLSGLNEAGLHRLDVTARRGNRRLLAPQWVRSATPEAVSAARARQLLDEELEAPDDERALATDDRALHCTVDATASEALVEIEATPRLPAGWEGVESVYRVSVASPLGSSAHVVHQTEAGGVWSPGLGWRFSGRFGADVDEPFLAVVVEEMNTGRWFGSLLECDEGF